MDTVTRFDKLCAQEIRLSRLSGHRSLIIARLAHTQGLSGPEKLHGTGSFRSHQFPLSIVKTSAEEHHTLQDWLASYKPQELFTEAGAPVPTMLSAIYNANHTPLLGSQESSRKVPQGGSQ